MTENSMRIRARERRRRPPWKGFSIFFVISAAVLALNIVAAWLQLSGAVPPPVAVEVIRVIDGDTIDVRLPPDASARLFKTKQKDITLRTVRLLDIDTPEIKHGNRRADYWGEEAGAALSALLQSGVRSPESVGLKTPDSRLQTHRVMLEFSAAQGLDDKFGRLLAFVWQEKATANCQLPTANRLLVQEWLVRNGHARVYEKYGLDPRYRRRLFAAQEAAKREGRGIWSRKAKG